MLTKTKKSGAKRPNQKIKHAKTIYDELWDKSQAVALYYGFTPVKPIDTTKDDFHTAKQVCEITKKDGNCSLAVAPEEKIAVLRRYLDASWQTEPHPVMISYLGHNTHVAGTKKTAGEKHVGLEILGTSKSISEAILIKASLEILHEAGYQDLYVSLNSIGDKDSIAKFGKELTNYYRKNVDALPAHCRQIMKHDVFELLSCEDDKCLPLKEGAPKSISFLSEPSRAHFKEILEYLEVLEIPYRMNNFLVGNKSFCTQVLFEIRSSAPKEENSKQPLALGLRYNNLAKKIGWKKDFPGVGVHLAFRQKTGKSEHQKLKCPRIYFVQLGFEAKIKSLKVIEMLRQAKIPVYQSLSKDKMTGQLIAAENLKIPYTIVMGQREALEDSVIVRNNTHRSQETILIKDLPNYLKHLK